MTVLLTVLSISAVSKMSKNNSPVKGKLSFIQTASFLNSDCSFSRFRNVC